MAPIARTLEITVISAEDLRRHRKPIKKNSFASVKIDSQNIAATQIDDRGGSYPFWNDKMALKLPSNVSFMTVDVHSGNFSRNKIVGTVNIPVSDFLSDFLPESYLHFLSYRLRDDRGERNGIVNISVRVLVPDHVAASTSQSQNVKVLAEKTNFGGSAGGGVAIGIPIWSGGRI
ncbi:BON1-associated protein 2-like [Benincasa hispida]|uniref:BON1-associated protein 2-like n=1 Tax=Benincasa hispida TaxID=102211 RepID=UPI001901EA8C|nr:BON1-associated protein 2-like [Benincasa hispida]